MTMGEFEAGLSGAAPADFGYWQSGKAVAAGPFEAEWERITSALPGSGTA